MSGIEKKVPQRRFIKFGNDEAWEQRKLEDVTDFLDEKRKPLESGIRESGQYPYYGASGIIDYVKGYLFDEELILLSEDGANIIDRNYRVCFLAKGKYWVNNHAHVLRSRHNYSNGFICEALERLNYDKYNTGTAQPKLNQEVCRNINIMIPGFREQEKIASFLCNLDNIITIHRRKLEKMKPLKKAYVADMFPAEEERKPKLRFAGFTDDWEQREFSDIFNLSQGLQIEISKRFANPGVNMYFYITNEFLKRDSNERYYIYNPPANVLCDESDILMTRTGNTGIVVTDVRGCFHNNFFKIDYDHKNYDKHFICQYLSTPNMQKKILNSAGSSTIPDLSHKSFYKLLGNFPDIVEQKRISDFLIKLDNIITLHQHKLEKLQNIKKAYLNEMFI
jgi:type I restriction enzyme, S subunit